MTRHRTLELIYSALGAAFIATLAQISLSIGPVPFTLQTFAVGLVASLFPRHIALSGISLYLAIGAIGLPVFAHFTGGLPHLIGPAGGFLWGFLLYAALTATLLPLSCHPIWIFTANLLGDTACFTTGLLFYSALTQQSLSASFALVVLPFLLPEGAKLILITLSLPLLKKRSFRSP